jgi:hypothetical protein
MPPTLYFAAEQTPCPRCGRLLTSGKTRTRTVATLTLNRFIAHETVCVCGNPACGVSVASETLAHLVPPQGTFGYDVIVHVGTQQFLHCRSEQEILHDLHRRGITISRSEIGVLTRKFIIYLAIAHRQSRPLLRKAMVERGGYILHLDGTCEADSPHLMSVIDGMSELVLGNAKLPSENADQIVPFLRSIKRQYGTPVALVHDMAKAILVSVEEVFPGIPDFLCHFHFLRDIGKDLLNAPYDILRKRLRALRIQGFLRQHARRLKHSIEQNTEVMDAFERCLQGDRRAADTPSPVTIAYVLIQWVLDGKHEGGGYGFPFDMPCMSLYQRLQSIHETMCRLRQICHDAPKGQKHLLTTLINGVEKVIADPLARKNARILQEKTVVFDRLRTAMRIALSDVKNGLNDEGSAAMSSIKKSVMAFCRELTLKIKSCHDPAYARMLGQIKLYRVKLFADPIVKKTPHGTVTIYPQRTNNQMERFFRDLRGGNRKRSGSNAMTRTLKTIPADTPLVANLRDPEYFTMLLKDARSLEERFALIDVQLVRKEMLRNERENRIVSPQVKRIVKRKDLLNKIAEMVSFGCLYYYDGNAWRDFLEEHPGFPWFIAGVIPLRLTASSVKAIRPGFRELIRISRLQKTSLPASPSIQQARFGVLSLRPITPAHK